jgi:hypothetical protein
LITIIIMWNKYVSSAKARPSLWILKISQYDLGPGSLPSSPLTYIYIYIYTHSNTQWILISRPHTHPRLDTTTRAY